MSPARSGTGPVTLLFTDLVGSTELAQRLGEAAADEFRRLHFDLLRAAITSHGGHEVKNLGDGLMAAFTSTQNALGAAVAMQEAVTAHNRSGREPRFAVRIGVQSGEPVLDDGDYFGTSVIVAKRLCDRAGAGQILAGEDAAQGVRPDGPPIRPLGPVDLKGLAEAVQAVEVVWDPDGSARADGPAPARPAHVVRPPALAPPPDGFFGREVELNALTGLLRDARLVSIIGPGGVGKTRLSGHLVDAVAPSYPDGVWCCALASVGADDDVSAAVATALRVERRAGVELTDRLVEFLAGKRALLVLDNCEQIVEGAAGLAGAVLAGTTSVDVLVTSREALGIAGEHRIPLEPLGIEPCGDPRSEPPAVTLFLKRAAAAGHRPDAGDLPAVRELCRRVDGLPLAIELAAARAATRTIGEIVADVTERLADLGARRGRPGRHRSIHAVVDWSYDLLDDADRRLFERLAVFAGGADAEAVAAVAGADRAAVVDRLDALADQSLVSTRSQGGSTRYALLEPVRAYAEQRLREHGRDDDARDAHAAHFVRLAERADTGLRGPDDGRWAAVLDRELANLRAAHRRLLATGDMDGSLRLASALHTYGFLGAVSETQAWAAGTAERFSRSGHPALGTVWAAAAIGAGLHGDLPRGRELALRSIDAAGPDRSRARMGLHALGMVELMSGGFERGAELLGEAQELHAAAGDAVLNTHALSAAACALSYAGRREDATRTADAALDVAGTRGNATMRAFAHQCAGEVCIDTDPERARGHLERSLAEAAQAGARLIVGIAGLSSISIEARHGDPVTALARYPALIDHWERVGALSGLWLTLRNLVETLARAGHGDAAATLDGAISASPAARPLAGPDVARQATVLDALRRSLDETELLRCRERGAGLGDAGVAAYAREVLRGLLEEP